MVASSGASMTVTTSYWPMVIALASTFTPSFSATGARRSRRSEVFFTSVRPCSVKLLRTTYIGMPPSVRSAPPGGSVLEQPARGRAGNLVGSQPEGPARPPTNGALRRPYPGRYGRPDAGSETTSARRRRWRRIAFGRRQVGLVQLRQSQLVRTDVAAQDGQSGQVGLQSGRAGAAVHQHHRLDAHIEQVHRDLQDAHVGVQADHPDLLELVIADPPGERLGHPGQAVLEKDIVVLGQRRQLVHQLRLGRAGARVPFEQCLVGRAVGVHEQRVQDRRIIARLDEPFDARRNVLGELVDEAALHIDDEEWLGHASGVRRREGWDDLLREQAHGALHRFRWQTADVEPGQGVGYTQLRLATHLGDAPVRGAVYDAVPPGLFGDGVDEALQTVAAGGDPLLTQAQTLGDAALPARLPQGLARLALGPGDEDVAQHADAGWTPGIVGRRSAALFEALDPGRQLFPGGAGARQDDVAAVVSRPVE